MFTDFRESLAPEQFDCDLCIVGAGAAGISMALRLANSRLRVCLIESGGFDIIEVIRYLARGDKPVGDGHILADLGGPRFRAIFADSPPEFAGSAMHNPFGRLKLVSMRDVAETN